MLEKVVSGVLVIISVLYLFESKDFSFGSFSQPGVGFMPIVVGILAVVLSIFNFISVMMKKDKRKDSKKNNETVSEYDFIKLAKFIIGCFIYVLLLKYTGFLIATFLVLMHLLKVTEVEGWTLPIIISAGTSISFYIIFQKMLGVLLP